MKIRSVGFRRNPSKTEGKIGGFAKERREHPSFTKAQVAQIIKDHTKVEKKSIEKFNMDVAHINFVNIDNDGSYGEWKKGNRIESWVHTGQNFRIVRVNHKTEQYYVEPMPKECD